MDRRELLYNASVLAHYAQVSTHADVDWPTPATLGAVFDHFVGDPALPLDGAMMETAGAQCLLLAGFFEDQIRGRHSIRWYAQLGAAFYRRAAAHEPSPPKARLLDTIARRFEPWRQCHARLSRELRDQPYLLAPPRPSLPPARSSPKPGHVDDTRRSAEAFVLHQHAIRPRTATATSRRSETSASRAFRRSV